MISIGDVNIWLILMMIGQGSAISYNQPKFCSNASWNPYATTFASSSLVGTNPYGIFVNRNNSVYIADRANNRIQVWFNNSINPSKTISGGLSSPFGIFVTNTGHIYIDNGYSNGRVDKWILNGSTSIPVMYVNGACGGLFVDINNTLYCSIGSNHNVVKKWLNSSSNQTTMVAGTGVQGSASNMLSQPGGIFVDINFDLYVADYGNNRIQLFRSGILNGTTVVGSGTPNPTITLNGPAGVILDGDNYLFITDSNNNRIVGSGPNGFRCIVGCSGSSGSTSNTLNNPITLSFDSYGNIFVSDKTNSRIQKFFLLTNLCVQSITTTNAQVVTPTTTLNPTSNALTTTLNPTSDALTTAIDPTSHAATTTLNPASDALTTTLNPTSDARTTTLNPTSYALTTAMDPTSHALITTINPTSDVATTTLNPTSHAATTTLNPTSHARTTTLNPTSYAATTTLNPTSHAASTTLNPTTIGSTTKVDSTIATASTTVTSATTQIEQRQITSIEPMTSTAMMTISTTTTTNRTCLSPTVTLIPGISTLSSPIQFRRSQDFYIISIIELNCMTSLSIIAQWTIKNCTSSLCLYQIQPDLTIITKSSELYIPARTLPYGIYELTLTVTMINSSSLTTSSSVYVGITPSGITANLVRYGTSMITSGHQQDLILNPGTYSVDPNENFFNASNWKYEYYCRIYGLYMFPNLQGSLLTIDDLRNDLSNPSCLSNRTGWEFGNSFQSSLSILSTSLQSNRTYQFMVYMENRRNSSLQATGYVLVKVEETHLQMIFIGCVISTLCIPNLEFQLINPTTQVALFSICDGNCTTTLQNITWNIYYSTTNPNSNFTMWTLFNQTASYQNIWFFGTNTTNFTSTNQLFLSNPQINLWRFEVVYSFVSQISSSSLNFVINQPPYNGSCSISPLNGTTSTLFNILCTDWYDDNKIKDYSIYGWTNDPSQKMIVAYSTMPTFQVRLPAGDDQTSLLNLIVYIRDTSYCIAEFNISSVYVVSDSNGIADLINDIQSSSQGITTNPIIQLLASENQNIVAQVMTSLCQQLNKMNNQNLDNIVSHGGVPATTVSISSLESQTFPMISMLLNESALDQYNQQLNSYANALEYLISFIANLAITTADSIKLQALSLAQLTKSTNQLTRSTLTIASERCYKLGSALNSMSTIIPYEDVQTAAIQLIQCAVNVLNAVNGPLQQRTNVLNTDFSDATTFPSDYDTDLESEWSNLNLFADGDDFSSEIIEKGRNIYYQKQLANQIISQINGLLSLLTSSLNIHLNIEQSIVINTSQVFMSLETKLIESLSNKLIQSVENAQIQFPENVSSDLSSDSKISIQTIMQPIASFGNSKISSNTNLSRSITLSILDQNLNEISIQTNLNNPIEIIIPHDPNLIIPPMILQNVTSMNITSHNQLFHLHYRNITTSLPISIHFEIQLLNITVAYVFIYKFDQLPELNSSINLIDGWTTFCPSNLTNENIYTYFIDNQKTSGHQFIIFGLRELNATEAINVCSNLSLNSPPITNQRHNFTSDYQLRTYTSGCYYLDQNNQWKSDGLTVGPLTNHNKTQCFSTHLTSFASGFSISPGSANWTYVFANSDFMKNKTIYSTVICVSVLYVILMIYAHYTDKKDIEKLGVTPLPDNHQSDGYFYQILVFTGQRKDAGTNSNVHFVISGDGGETWIRTLADPRREILQRGGVNAFIMAVPKSLGLLHCIRIWHDNTGKGSSSSWFLKYIIIRDLQTMEKSHFICQKWFAIEKDDGKIERVLSAASELEKHEFSYVLSKSAYHSVSDGHLWFSVFSRPPSNKFTRVQRCTCCFVLLFLLMFLNIMYYDVSNQDQTMNTTSTASLSFGPFYITPKQIIIGIIVDLFAFIPSLLLVQLFRRLRTRKKQHSSLRQTLYNIKPHLQINGIDQKKNKVKFSITFPWWCIFIAYGLCVILVSLSILFIIARGIEFGDLKSQKWLTSILSGFFSSIFVTQPSKILCLTLFFACFCRKSNDDKEANGYLDNDQIALDTDEEYLHSIEGKSLFTYRSPIRIHHLNSAELAYARDQRLKEIQMQSIIREALVYFCFLSFLYIAVYSNRESNSSFQVSHLRKYFLNFKQADYDYTRISTINDYWDWLEYSFIENLRAQQWYNNDPPRYLNGFINDKSNRLIGWATMRQLRIKSELCHISNQIISKCQYDYSLFNEENNSYQPGWLNQTVRNFSSSIRQAFQYRSSKDLDTYIYVGDHATYSGDGYVYEFRGRLSDLQSNLSQLHQLEWIDYRTRAVIIQLTLYNPNVELFTSVTFLTEFLSTGGIYPTVRFEPMNFLGIALTAFCLVFTSIFQLISTILYMLMMIYFMWIEIQLLIQLKWKYFCRFWSFIGIGIIVCSLTSVGIYIWRYHEYQRIEKLFKETNGYVYINLQLATYVNDILSFLFGFSCFFATIKSIGFCRYNRRLCIFTQTLRYAKNDLISFVMMFLIVFLSFICLFYLLFISQLSSCSSLLATAQILFQMTLTQFNADELNGVAVFWGPLAFSLFIIIVVFICMSMFISILNNSFRRAQEYVNIHNEDMFSYMIKRFRRWIGFERTTDEESIIERDAIMHREYFDPIERFPEKIDQLLNALDRIYRAQRSGKTTENCI